MDCCDRGYYRPSLQAVGSTSLKPGVLACRSLQGTVQVRFAPPPAVTRWHTLLHNPERAIRAISGLAGFLYLALGVFMQNTDQGTYGPSNPATTALHHGECKLVSKITNDKFNLGKQLFFVKANFIAVKCGFLVFQYTFRFTVLAGIVLELVHPVRPPQNTGSSIVRSVLQLTHIMTPRRERCVSSLSPELSTLLIRLFPPAR
jgi:hypothetical protein